MQVSGEVAKLAAWLPSNVGSVERPGLSDFVLLFPPGSLTMTLQL